jgi:hypothetical protein
MNLNVTQTMAGARQAMTDGAFQQAASMASDAQSVVREEMQRKTAGEIETIVEKLHSGDAITEWEISLIKAWIVGDAEGYVEMENNLPDWLAEYGRLQESLADFEGKDCSAEELLALHGILEDATRISYEIANFLEKQERMKRLDSALANGLDQSERDVLARVLTERLRSPDR